MRLFAPLRRECYAMRLTAAPSRPAPFPAQPRPPQPTRPMGESARGKIRVRRKSDIKLVWRIVEPRASNASVQLGSAHLVAQETQRGRPGLLGRLQIGPM